MKRIAHALTEAAVLCVVTAMALPAQTPATLQTFVFEDGGTPYDGLIQGTDGNLYGTTYWGGSFVYAGTVFKITPSGRFTTLYNFCSHVVNDLCVDGILPYAGLVQANDGRFYGTTTEGGVNGNWGTVFEITPEGGLATLQAFCSQAGCADGANPMAGLVQATNGDLYGATSWGGAGESGTIFKITPTGTFTNVSALCCSDRNGQVATLIQASDGDLYGTTEGAYGGYGTVFQVAPSGTLTTLYTFCSQSGCPDGANPHAGLLQANDGNFYGTTYNGGANGNYGTVFKLTSSGALTTLYSFCSQSGCADGANPGAALIQATDGNFYGTTQYGGANGNYGTIFKITPSGALATLYSFCSRAACFDGYLPNGLVQATNGDIYGTTYYAGLNRCDPGCGTVFSLSVGLGPFVKAQPTSGKVGAVVKILGTDLSGASSVTFNGTPAVFGVSSSSKIVTEITTTVPAGATTGTVQVVTPTGTLLSNVPFRVLP